MDVDPIWGVLKAALLEVLLVQIDAFSPSEVAKPVPTSELVLVCWGNFEVEYFHSEFVVALSVMVKFVSVDEMCLFAICGQFDRSHFVFNNHRTRKEVSLGDIS